MCWFMFDFVFQLPSLAVINLQYKNSIYIISHHHHLYHDITHVYLYRTSLIQILCHHHRISSIIYNFSAHI